MERPCPADGRLQQRPGGRRHRPARRVRRRVRPASVEGGAEAFLRAWAAGQRPTAVLAMSDAMAIGVLSAARQLGLDVPDDLSIVGFDDIELATLHGSTTHDRPPADAAQGRGGGPAAPARPAPPRWPARASTGSSRPSSVIRAIDRDTPRDTCRRDRRPSSHRDRRRRTSSTRPARVSINGGIDAAGLVTVAAESLEERT